MAVQPNISLAVETPQAPDPLELAAKGLSIRSMQQQQLLHGEQLKSAQIANQEHVKAQQDDTLNTQTWQQSNGDPDKHVELFAKSGARPQAVQALQKHYADLRKEYAETGSKEAETKKYTNQQLAGITSQAMEDPNYEQNWGQYVAAARQVDPKVNLPGQAPPKETLAHIRLAYTTDEILHKEADERRAEAKRKEDAAGAQREADLHPFKQAEEQAKADQITRETYAREHPDDQSAQQAALTSQQRLDKVQKDRAFSEELRSHLSNEATAKITAAVAQGRLAQEQMVNGMKYGPGTTEYWVKQLQENPDSIKEMPAELRSKVGQGFTQGTGLPLPTPLGESAKTQETAARNALDGASFITEVMKNPEIRKQLGPIMGRLQNVEQSIGAAVGLSPEATKLAQELRTRMRYFVFQEGKAVLGGRLPQQLMKQLEESSSSVKMEPAMLEGALSGAVGNARSILDNTDRQRFGGKMRSREQRGQGTAKTTVTMVAPDGKTTKEVDPSEVAHYEQLGAKRQ